MENYFKNKSLLTIIRKWKIHLLIIMILSIVLSAFFSSEIFIKPKFKSIGVVYPINLYLYSDESEAEQMLQMFQSRDIITRLESDFSLYEHYKINPKDKFAYTYLLAEINENISFRKTEYESIEIKVLDINPLIASNIVDSIIVYFNKKVSILHRIKHKEVVEISSTDLKSKEEDISLLENDITELRIKYGLLDFEIQSKELTRGQVKVLAEGKSSTSKEILNLIDNLKTKGEELKGLDVKIKYERIRADSITKVLEDHISAYNKKITYAQVVSYPYAADKKSYPVRWIIVLLSVLSALLLSIIAIGMIESKKE